MLDQHPRRANRAAYNLSGVRCGKMSREQDSTPTRITRPVQAKALKATVSQKSTYMAGPRRQIWPALGRGRPPVTNGTAQVVTTCALNLNGYKLLQIDGTAGLFCTETKHSFVR